MNVALAIALGVAVVAVIVAVRARARALRDAAAARAESHRAEMEISKRLDETQHENEVREQILSAMDEGVILASGTAIIYANPAARTLFGIGESSSLPATIPQPAGAETVTREIVLHHPARKDVRLAVVRVGTDQLLVVAQDVTETKRIDDVRKDFVANASHEMKTPVAAILATAETLQDAIGDDPKAAERFAATLTKEARRLSTLVGDLLSLARLEQPLQDDATVDLSELVNTIAKEMQPDRLAMTIDVEPGVNVRGRQEDLRLLIGNLIDNAIRYTPNGGSVTVRLTSEGVLAVEDTGVGIPSKDLPRVFERFFRVDASRARDTGGTGLGLAIVKHVAESHGGTVGARSELGKGSVFTVSLPVAGAR